MLGDSVSCVREQCSSSQQGKRGGWTTPTCISQSFSGAFPGRSTSPIHSTCTMWKVSHPKMALTQAKGDPALPPPSALGFPWSALVFGAGSAAAVVMSAGGKAAIAAVAAAACDESAVSALFVGTIVLCCFIFWASCFCLRAFS